jgi:serine phosphatase RsbU (regulator of sigma subunit)/FixJ family two-component response regulator
MMKLLGSSRYEMGQTQEEAPTTSQSPSIPSSSLLIVDDNNVNRILLSRYITKLGHQAAQAGNGRQALEKLQSEPFDLVLLDVQMPEMDGYQVLKQLKANPRLRDIPVIMISAIEELESVVRCIELGAEDYLPKPFDPVLLNARISACLEKKRLRDHEVAYLQHVSRVIDAAVAVETNTFNPESLEEVARRPDALGNLARVFQHMVNEIHAREQRLTHEARVRERIEQEMRVAKLIQQTLLPRELPSLPNWRIAAHYQPAQAVGGDFYDFLPLPDGKLGIFIGDVSGKGVPAALVMATTRSVLRASAQSLITPGQVLEKVNDLLYLDIPTNMFVTCLYALLDPQEGRLHFANAGHVLPHRRRTASVTELRATGMPLGLMPSMHYEERETVLAPGDAVLFYSDGLVEAHDTMREMFGLARLQRLIATHSGSSAALIDYLLTELTCFTGAEWEQEDDITLVILQHSTI